ncbi:MAG: hypothetical protein WBD36_02510 [Bacteroidota bacterium]
MITKAHIVRYSTIVLFGVLGVQGIWGACHNVAHCDTLGKSLQALAQFGYGAFGLLIAFRLMMKKTRLHTMEFAWSVCVVFAAGAAPSQWGNAPMVATLMSTLAAAVIVAGALWLLRASQGAVLEEWSL